MVVEVEKTSALAADRRKKKSNQERTLGNYSTKIPEISKILVYFYPSSVDVDQDSNRCLVVCTHQVLLEKISQQLLQYIHEGYSISKGNILKAK